MHKFIAAMGATHTDEDKLKNIIMESIKSKPYTLAIDHRELHVLIANGLLDRESKLYSNIKWVAEKKIDGYSYINDRGTFYSKGLSTAKGNEGMPIDKTDWMPHLRDTMSRFADILADLHGELHIPGKTSDDVTTILGCTADESVRRQEENPDMRINFVVFDIRRCMGIDLINYPWYVRRAVLEHLFSKINTCNYVTLSEIIEDPIEGYRDIISNGGEGLIFKNTAAKYTPGKKPANVWVKAKKMVTIDAFIMGFNDGGSGKNTNLFKSIRIGIMIENANGTQTEQYIGDVHSGISDALRVEMHNNRESFIGRVIEVEAMDYNYKRYSCRHARMIRFRDDKSMHDCGTDGINLCLDLI